MATFNNPTDACLSYVNQTNRSVFLTGKAGTGKTTLLKRIIQESPKNTVVVAPTGIAALNAGGVTIHSMFYLPFASFIPDYGQANYGSGAMRFETRSTLSKHFIYNKTKKRILENMELLIIDEVSMLRADVVDAIDWALRHVRKINAPFGGVQVLFIGDLLQLPPIVKPGEWEVLRKYYKGIHFFNALALQENPPIYIELDKIYRQSDEHFIHILNELRNNQLSYASLERLNSYVQPDFDPKPTQNYITLTTHNHKADTMNQAELAKLTTPTFTYEASVKKKFPENIYPIDTTLTLKVGAQVMFIKNDLNYEKRYYNGKIGVVESLDADEIMVRFPEENKTIKVDLYEWENISYQLNPDTNQIEGKVVGTFVHYPLKLAWAITVHKSQGLTFEKAILDVSDVFAAGQAYVALSRLRSLDGLVLKTPFRLNGIASDEDVIRYAQTRASNEELSAQFEQSVMHYLHTTLKRTFDWHDLEEIWRKHVFSYKGLSQRSEKIKHHAWAETQFTAVKSIVDVAKKFVLQIDKIFAYPTVNITFVNERVEKAYDHFYEQLDKLVYNVLKRRYMISTLKRVKEFQDELEEIDEQQIEVVLQLKRVKKLLHAISEGKVLTKADLADDSIQEYRKAKFISITEESKGSSTALDFDTLQEEKKISIDSLLKTKKEREKKPKVEKKPTHISTYELYQEGKTIEEIADARVLSVTTIEGHFVKLIGEGKVAIIDLLSPDKIQELKDFFDGLANVDKMLLSDIKNAAGDRFTWSEIKLYRGHLEYKK